MPQKRERLEEVNSFPFSSFGNRNEDSMRTSSYYFDAHESGFELNVWKKAEHLYR